MHPSLQLFVFDMAGTTFVDNKGVESCFKSAAESTGLEVSSARINAVMGWPKRKAVEILWEQHLPASHPEFKGRVDKTYHLFAEILFHFYQEVPLLPTPGAEELFKWLHDHHVPIALNTGFYHDVADTIVRRLGWIENGLVDYLVTSEDVNDGRPHPDMIYRSMELAGVQDVKSVAVIGDTPADFAAGRAAGCGWVLGVTNGSHSRADLQTLQFDGLFDSLEEVALWLNLKNVLPAIQNVQ